MLPPLKLVRRFQDRLEAAGVVLTAAQINELVAAHLGYRTHGAMRAGRARGRPLMEQRISELGLEADKDVILHAMER